MNWGLAEMRGFIAHELRRVPARLCDPERDAKIEERRALLEEQAREILCRQTWIGRLKTWLSRR